MSADIFTILAVCTGNVCRSPAAERLLAYKLGPTVGSRPPERTRLSAIRSPSRWRCYCEMAELSRVPL